MPTVFVVTPFSGIGARVWKGIAAACADMGFACSRGDSTSASGVVLTQIRKSIAAADIVVVEMSGRNPNVYYETGFAHALGKPTIFLAASPRDLWAFNTSAFRHFLHNGDPGTARGKLFDALRAVEQETSFKPDVPDARALYEWPSAPNSAPDFTWRSDSAERHLQLDLDGGQRIVQALSGIGRLITITDTTEFWNHRPDYSIMRLALTTELAAGDFVYLVLEGRCSGKGQFSLVGDGGWIEGTEGRRFAESWPEQNSSIEATVDWSRWTFIAKVDPPAGYDLSRGTTVYLMTKVDKATVFLKSISLLRRRIT